MSVVTTENNTNKSTNEQSENTTNSSKEIIKSSRNDSDEEYLYQKAQTQEKIRDFLILKEIGQGAFGSVFLVQKENTKKKICIKSNK